MKQNDSNTVTVDAFVVAWNWECPVCGESNEVEFSEAAIGATCGACDADVMVEFHMCRK